MLVVTYLLPVAHILMTASIYLTLAITIERYTTVFHPWYKVRPATYSAYLVFIIVFAHFCILSVWFSTVDSGIWNV